MLFFSHPKQEINTNYSNLSAILEISYEILANEKFIWSERAVDINLSGKQKNIQNSFSITSPLEVFITKTYNKLKPIKIKGLTSKQKAPSLSVETVELFSVEESKNKNMQLETNNDVMYQNYNTFTEPSYNNNNSLRKNKLLEYLPKISRHSVSPIGNRNNFHINNNSSLTNINHEMMQLDAQYEIMKKDLIELNPLLKTNSALREQFFVNVSEGKEEKYVFIKNLYNIINDSAMNNKPVFKTSITSKKMKFKNLPVPNMTSLHSKLVYGASKDKKMSRQIIVNNFNGIRQLNKSASGSRLNIKRNNGLNFLEGINVK